MWSGCARLQCGVVRAGMATNSADPRHGGSTGGRLHQTHGSSVLPPRSIGSGETFRLKDAKHRLLICINARD